MRNRDVSETTTGHRRDLLELIDRLHMARIRPRMACSSTARACGDPSQGTPSERPCIRHLREGHQFPVAQCILDGTAGDGLFRRVQEWLGILQLVVLFGQLVDQPTRTYKLEHLESIPGLRLRVPWIRRIEDHGSVVTYEPDPKAPGMAGIFRQFRERVTGVQEFVRLLESADGRELILSMEHSGVGHGLASFQTPSRLSRDEDDHHFLLVTDQEQSFFSLLYVLAEAHAHAEELAVDLDEWFDDGVALRSVLSHSHGSLDAREPDGSRGDRPLEHAPGHFWAVMSFSESMNALGFTTSTSGSLRPTERFRRLQRQLSECAGWHPLRTAQIDHPCGNLASIVLKHCRGILDRDYDPVTLARSLARVIVEVYPNGSREVSASENVRFNLPGEALLRKGEVSSRSFFATPLSYVHDQPSERPLAAAFVVGTIDDLNSFDEESQERIRALRALLRALVTFGTDVSQTWLLVARREQERMQDLNHSIRNAFNPIILNAEGLMLDAPRGDFQRQSTSLFAGLRVLRWLLVQALPGQASEHDPPPSSLFEIMRAIKAALDNDLLSSTLTIETVDWALEQSEASEAFSVLFNLWTNARKAASDENPNVEVRLYELDGEVRLSVSNNGQSMPEAFKNYLLGRNFPPCTDGLRSPQTGLRMVMSSLRSLGWRIVDIDHATSTDSATRVLLSIGRRTVTERNNENDKDHPRH